VESSCEFGTEPSSSIMCWETIEVAAQLVASRVVPSSTELLILTDVSTSEDIRFCSRAGQEANCPSCWEGDTVDMGRQSLGYELGDQGVGVRFIIW
jgi:hypothetical protein